MTFLALGAWFNGRFRPRPAPKARWGIAHGNMLTPRKPLAAKLMNLRLSNSPAVVNLVFIMIGNAKGSYWMNEN